MLKFLRQRRRVEAWLFINFFCIFAHPKHILNSDLALQRKFTFTRPLRCRRLGMTVCRLCSKNRVIMLNRRSIRIRSNVAMQQVKTKTLNKIVKRESKRLANQFNFHHCNFNASRETITRGHYSFVLLGFVEAVTSCNCHRHKQLCL